VPVTYFLPDLDLAVPFARKVLPPYGGGDVVLHRGQLAGEPPAMSWTWRPDTAWLYATRGLGGWDNPERPNGVILSALVPADSVICAPCIGVSWHGQVRQEFIVDPRGIEFVTEPADTAIRWIEPIAVKRVLRSGAPPHEALNVLRPFDSSDLAEVLAIIDRASSS
jgi:hypothetical protein